MRTLSATEWLAVWERGQGEPPYRRAILLLSAACPERSPDELAGIAIGARDSLLLTLREWTFGRRLDGVVECPACGERLEIEMTVDDVRATAPAETRDAIHVAWDGYDVVFRLPATVDLDGSNGGEGGENLRAALLRRCVLEARRGDEEVDVDRLPEPVVEAVVARMAELDPQADTRLDVVCPDCGHRWHALFDIVSFFWGEIRPWAFRLLREVHVLASAYGWREADILAMSALRRRSYLSMVGA